MPPPSPLLQTDLRGLRLLRRGKVRDVYEVGDHLLIVATDRLSAFDYVLGSGVPDKGRVLSQLSAFWFRLMRDIVPNHLVSDDAAAYPEPARAHAETIAGRSMLVRRTEPLPIECVARGYLSGSGWKEYRETGRVCGVTLPHGLSESSRLAEPIFTPATKAESGHDVNITEADAARVVGEARLAAVKAFTLALYTRGAAHAAERGIIVADTKFEFGTVRDADGRETLILIDELLTPDSSRFWPAATYEPGGPQPSLDKQFVRDYLEAIGWSKQPPVPALPPDVVERTRATYLDAFRRLTGAELA